ncbi:pirin family protein RNJ42_01768 [Nakaseomyces bracarensis]|uniref:pirin family protein n=1 Tax=Nakaseomyces bracarensis TaxID=273131 RepID=UPI003871F602
MSEKTDKKQTVVQPKKQMSSAKLLSMIVLVACVIYRVYYSLNGEADVITGAPAQDIPDDSYAKLKNINDNMNQDRYFRSVNVHFVAGEQNEGVGARVRRSVGSYQMRRFTPFLMLDDFTVAPPNGFPDHPHHGQETITYVTDGMIAHEDITGSKGVLFPGDLQFMTAGKGIVHSEIPVTTDDGKPCRGLQLWVDLPKDMKNIDPRYRNLRANKTPIAYPSDDLEVRVISGKSYGVESVRDLAYTPIHFYHFITKKAGTEWVQDIPENFNVFIYVSQGSITIDGEEIPKFSSVFFNADGNAVKGVSASEDAEFAIIAGEILDQEVVQHGPFVETNREKLMEVFKNYREETNGFEGAHSWRSSIHDGISETEARKLYNEDQ